MPAFGLTSQSVPNPSTSSPEVIDESTPWIAASDGDINLLQRSIQTLNLSINAADSNGFTFLHSASSYGQLDMIRWLLSQQVTDVNVKDSDGDTPLHHCDDVITAKLLVQEGKADFSLRNNDGKTALEVKEEEFLDNDNMEDDDSSGDTENLKDLIQYLKGVSNGTALMQ
mmetsp:Transcript_21661/g.30357  ORF Transcript_21661/g.30357 Transcript_21661/m.30357 type:complete len:170 (+) Transcript_21661:77-586(+)|eukprot:CAMPEP_0184863310 /NCGR_PEP_ID=MMETSP0580-20130426/10502_1 /TAXON_ID=1118495 /ORGANISM="Dactyliosolen fragilissimus" /LENGTH=169 /DNA_ID=CAMNT_0027361573 /DNA_START=28 /DNA_END=537 /DNA_ORIENTATION=-